MANRPAADKDAAPRKPAAKKAAPRASAKAKPEVEQAKSASGVDGQQVLKEGVSKLFSRGRELLSEKGPGLLSSIERVTHSAIDQTAKGLTAFERMANEAEAKVGQGLKDLVDRRRTADADEPKSKGPKV